ncbi:MAG TPA: response regulator transcription factor [Cyclobacteriaceae bacterium]|jgi:DNA-binding NarL/FixJ family response regulator|nr:response regulator transcription factor [Cyclobacteriaceae bacterium]
MFVRKKVIIIEHDEIWQNSVVHLVDGTDRFVVGGCYADWDEASSNVLRIKPDVVVMEIVGPGRQGIAEISVIKEKLPDVEILIVTSQDEDSVVIAALRAGASGYILKSANFVEIILGIEEIVRGGSPLSSRIARKVIQNLHRNPDTPFTRRELEVLGLVARGHSSSQISQQLFISRDTTKTHIRNIYSKLDVNKKADAIELAHRRRYI